MAGVKDLSSVAGLPLFLDGSRLHQGTPRATVQPTRTRRVDGLTGLWRDSSVHGQAEVYSTYLHVWRPEHQAVFDAWHLDHGLVVMPPGLYGGEYPKLYGHYHPPAPGGHLALPEVYSVLHGVAHFLLQKSVPPYEEVTDVVVVEVHVGDRFLVPPDYGHLAINPGQETLVFAGVLAHNLDGAYEPYRQRGGGAYYAVVGEASRPRWSANPSFPALPPPRYIRASDVSMRQGLGKEPCYSQVVRRPQEFAFLLRPERFLPEWAL